MQRPAARHTPRRTWTPAFAGVEAWPEESETHGLRLRSG
ncbi:hypothetical protein SUS17_512 [Sphingomonas sp. S17]|nr:hypothetical protein SUS17_512 [Sphingomonas sp. S17]